MYPILKVAAISGIMACSCLALSMIINGIDAVMEWIEKRCSPTGDTENE